MSQLQFEFKLLKNDINNYYNEGIHFIENKYILYKISNTNFFIYKNKCKHQGGKFINSSDKDIVVCSFHGWKFNVKTEVKLINE